MAPGTVPEALAVRLLPVLALVLAATAPFPPGADAAEADAPVIALVFDDLGYATDGLAGELLDLPVPVTFAVLPGLRHSAAFAESARARGHDVILHVPMEPVDGLRHDPGPGALLLDFPPEENDRRLLAALDGLPFFLGASNHMGSRFTSDPDAIGRVLHRLRERDPGLFWLDSRTTSGSVAAERARALGVPCLANDLFLEGSPERSVDPHDQVRRLDAIARRRGRAIAIGHVRPATLEAVRAAIPAWRAAGIRLVGLSELVHREARGASPAGVASAPGG